MNTKEILNKLNASFGSYRAEWLKSQIFDLFAEPYYFSVLQDNRPCVLEGGRGTGKTTVLRGLSYQGQFAIHKQNVNNFDKANFIGIYHRVNTNHVRAFTGGNLVEREWERVFAHYFNLLICRDILIFLKWHNGRCNNDEQLSPHACKVIANSINSKETCENLDALLELFDLEMYSFQSEINNIVDGDLPKLSMAGDPIKVVTENALNLIQFKDKIFFILLDEYENYTDYQQKILNSLLKHSPESYTFKIGVRELGWRVKHTLNTSETLYDPADYVLVNIERSLTGNDSLFSDFARTVCQQRITKLLVEENDDVIYDIEESLKGMTIEEEAEMLEVRSTLYVKNFDYLPKAFKVGTEALSPLYKYFISYWASVHDRELVNEVDDYLKHTGSWNTRYGNYKYEMLFKIRRGRGKSGIQKYYCGWTTYTKLSNGNIRYLMELVYRAYEKHLISEEPLNVPVSPKNQTLAAQEAGYKNLMELEGLWKNGAQLTKLLLGMGRVFQVLASSEGKSAPEKNQFSLEKTYGNTEEVEDLIRAAVMHLALIRTPGNKMSDDSTTRDYLYMIHPLYSAYFQFSHRKKRKINIKAEDVFGIINNPRETIRFILQKSDIKTESIDKLPQQMSLFEEYYNEK